MSDYSTHIVALHTTLMRFENAVKQAKGKRNPELVKDIADTLANQVTALEALTNSTKGHLETAYEALSPDHNDYEGSIS